MRPASSVPDGLAALATNCSTNCSRIALRWTAPVWGIAARQMAAPNSGVRIRRRLSPLMAFSPFTHRRLNVFLLGWAGPVQKRARPPSLLIRSLRSPDFDHCDFPSEPPGPKVPPVNGVLISISATFQRSGNVAGVYVDVIVTGVPAAGTAA